MTLLQTSGSISLSELAVEYGGVAGTQMSLASLYRGGTRVDSTYTSTQKYSLGFPLYTYWFTDTNSQNALLYWYSSSSYTTSSSATSLTTTYAGATGYPSFSSFTLYRGDIYNTVTDKGRVQRWYKIYASYSVNPNVPSSGEISFSNFYGQGSPRTPE